MAHRFYAGEPVPGTPDRFLLSGEDTRHAQRVLRLEPGAEIELFHNGERYLAVLCEPLDGCLTARTSAPLPSTEAALRLTLFQGLPKADKMEWIIQKAVELGVSRIVPVRMRRCVVQISPKDAPRKLERWQRIAREACKQSGRCVVPEVAAPVDFQELPALAAVPEACVVPWEESRDAGPKAFARAHPDLTSLGIVIGPEGGISGEEMAQLSGLCTPITLGRRILRTETAGLAAVAAFLALYGEMELV